MRSLDLVHGDWPTLTITVAQRSSSSSSLQVGLVIHLPSLG